jgi:threonine/homoserine/homoserine lactone efflux protein
MTVLYLLQGLTLGLSAAATPGTFQAFIIGQSLKNGWRRTLPAVFAPVLAEGPIILMMTFLLTQMPSGFMRAIRIIGGVFVLFLAWRTYRAYRNYQPVMLSDASSQTLWQAIGANLLSPGPYLFWSMLAGPILVKAWAETPANGLVFLFGFYLALVGGSASLVILFSASRQLGPKVNRTLIGVSALALLGFGLYQLWQGLL